MAAAGLIASASPTMPPNRAWRQRSPPNHPRSTWPCQPLSPGPLSIRSGNPTNTREICPNWQPGPEPLFPRPLRLADGHSPHPFLLTALMHQIHSPPPRFGTSHPKSPRLPCKFVRPLFDRPQIRITMFKEFRSSNALVAASGIAPSAVMDCAFSSCSNIIVRAPSRGGGVGFCFGSTGYCR